MFVEQPDKARTGSYARAWSKQEWTYSCMIHRYVQAGARDTRRMYCRTCGIVPRSGCRVRSDLYVEIHHSYVVRRGRMSPIHHILCASNVIRVFISALSAATYVKITKTSPTHEARHTVVCAVWRRELFRHAFEA